MNVTISFHGFYRGTNGTQPWILLIFRIDSALYAQVLWPLHPLKHSIKTGIRKHLTHSLLKVIPTVEADGKWFKISIMRGRKGRRNRRRTERDYWGSKNETMLILFEQSQTKVFSHGKWNKQKWIQPGKEDMERLMNRKSKTEKVKVKLRETGRRVWKNDK